MAWQRVSSDARSTCGGHYACGRLRVVRSALQAKLATVDSGVREDPSRGIGIFRDSVCTNSATGAVDLQLPACFKDGHGDSGSKIQAANL